MTTTSDIAVIGAGAAGLAAAIFAGETVQQRQLNHRITLLDGAKTIGAKILVSGGGRCNVTHAAIRPGDYFGSSAPLRNVLSAFPQPQTVEWFESIGVLLKTEQTGKLFPESDKARTVLDALIQRAKSLSVNLLSDFRVTRVARPENTQGSFVISHSQGVLHARCVIMATGGRSLPRTGSDGLGWEILKSLGHTVTSTHAALVPLVLDGGFFHRQLSGLSHEAEITTYVGGKRIDRRTGSLLWTHFGISGPVVMDASRFFTMARDRGQSVEVHCNLLPGETQESLEAWLLNQSTARPKASVATVLAERLPSRLVEELIKRAGIDTAIILSQFSKEARRTLVGQIIRLRLPVNEHRGWNYAEVTTGGVPMSEVDFRTMESRVVPGLYLVGELLDVDGRIGGFNFQWAWSTGYVAGRAAPLGLG